MWSRDIHCDMITWHWLWCSHVTSLGELWSQSHRPLLGTLHKSQSPGKGNFQWKSLFIDIFHSNSSIQNFAPKMSHCQIKDIWSIDHKGAGEFQSFWWSPNEQTQTRPRDRHGSWCSPARGLSLMWWPCAKRTINLTWKCFVNSTQKDECYPGFTERDRLRFLLKGICLHRTSRGSNKWSAEWRNFHLSSAIFIQY